MIEELLRELKETWGYETEELNDIREKLEELAHSYFWMGYGERNEEMHSASEFTAYGKPEDFE